MDSFSSFLTQPGVRVKVVGRNCGDLLPYLKSFPIQLLAADDPRVPALVISSGGDGALLGAERDYPGIPKCPIRDRARNPKCPRHSELTILEKLFAGDLHHDFLAKLLVRNGAGEELAGINDIVTSRQVQLGAIRCRIRQDGELLRSQVISDGIVICTPFGSTGYFQSITRGNFQQGIGLAYNNAMDGESFTVLPEDAHLDLEILRGPATVMADNNPHLLQLNDGEHVQIRLSDERTLVFGMDAFRCQDCYLLRRNGMQ